MSLKHRARILLRRIGIDVSRWPSGTSWDRCAKLLAHHRISVVADVGANEGQFAAELRRCGYGGRIISFEPYSTAYAALQRSARDDPDWIAINTAIGPALGTAVLNISANSVSSSILPMLPTHSEAAKGSGYVSQEIVKIDTLDNQLADRLEDRDRLYLKIDAQGYTKPIIDGADKAIERATGMQIELSLVPLYEGEALLWEFLPYFRSQGFTLMGVEPGFTDPRTGQTLQIDAIWYRSG